MNLGTPSQGRREGKVASSSTHRHHRFIGLITSDRIEQSSSPIDRPVVLADAVPAEALLLCEFRANSFYKKNERFICFSADRNLGIDDEGLLACMWGPDTCLSVGSFGDQEFVMERHCFRMHVENLRFITYNENFNDGCTLTSLISRLVATKAHVM